MNRYKLISSIGFLIFANIYALQTNQTIGTKTFHHLPNDAINEIFIHHFSDQNNLINKYLNCANTLERKAMNDVIIINAKSDKLSFDDCIKLIKAFVFQKQSNINYEIHYPNIAHDKQSQNEIIQRIERVIMNDKMRKYISFKQMHTPYGCGWQIQFSDMLKETLKDLTILGHKRKFSLQKLCANKPRILSLRNNGLISLDIFSDFDKLKLLYLDLSDNKLSNIDALSHLKSLKSLYLNNNKISNITALKELLLLCNLDLENNNISDITSLVKLTELKYLLLSNNEINDITPLSNMYKLNTVYLKNNKLTSIDVLANDKFSNLDSIFIFGNQLINITNFNAFVGLNMRIVGLNFVLL